MPGSQSPSPTLQDWRARVDRDLRGRDFERALVTRTLEGLDIQPLYTDGPDSPELPGQFPYRRGASALGATRDGWEIRQPASSVQQALDELHKGARALSVEDPDLVSALVAAVDTSLAPIHLVGPASAKAAQVVGQVASGGLGLSPLTELAERGGLDGTLEQAWEVAAACIQQSGPNTRALALQTTTFHHAGASEVQDLALGLAAQAETLRALEARGVAPEQVFENTELRLALDSRMFLGIAKLRAARQLHARLAQACGMDWAPVIHAQLSWRVTTRRDVWVNLLRNTTAVFAAAVGGAQAISSLPFADCAQPADQRLAARVARNTQLVLAEESHLGRVIDPAGGAFAPETWTAELAQTAWAAFQEIERQGGYLQALQSGWIHDWIAPVRAQRQSRIASRRQPITGVSEFPLLSERRPELREERVGLWTAAPTTSLCAPLSLSRDASAYEELRDRGDAAGNPAVFLAAIGPVASHTARVGFASNLLQAGGFTPAPQRVDLDSVVKAFADSGASLACICGSDAGYAEHAAALATALKSAGAQRVLLAGKPGEQEPALREAGVDAFIYLRCDALAALTDLWEAL